MWASDGTYMRRGNNATSWRDWTKQFGEDLKPSFGSNDLLESGATVASLDNFKTILGPSAGYIGQTAWGTLGVPTTRLNNLSDAGQFNSLANVSTKPLSLLDGRTADFISYTTGGTVNSLKPGEAGANITESRIASGIFGQGPLATASAVGSQYLVTPDSANRFPDPAGIEAVVGGPAGSPTVWTLAGSVAAGQVSFQGPRGSSANPSNNSFNITGGVAGNGGLISPAFDVEADEVLQVTCQAGAVNAGGQTANCESVVYIRWYNNLEAASAGGGLIGSNVEIGRSTATHSGLTTMNISRIVKAPPGAVKARLYFYRVGNANTDGARFSYPIVRRAVDVRNLPRNAFTGHGAVLNPASPLGSNAAASISVAASTVTYAGGSVLSLPSATINGLTAGTVYAVYRDLHNANYIAVSSGYGAYTTEADRYLLMGYQTTQTTQGGFPIPLPPPPGGGGGWEGGIRPSLP